jgi:probable HAF family extracellular repeat protein
MKRHTLAAVAALLILLPWHEPVLAEPPQYAVENLGTFGGVVPTVSGINASGEVIGNVNVGGLSKALRYVDGHWAVVPGLETVFYSAAFGINSHGDIAGFLINGSFEIRAFRYRDGFPIDEIAPLPGGTQSFAFAINDSGEIVGYSDTPTSMQVAFRALPPAAPVQVPSLNGTSLACGLNNAGQVAGWSFTPGDGAQHAIRVDVGLPATDIVPFDGAAGTSMACAIDGDGTVGGKSTTLGGQLHAFKYNGSLHDLDTFGSTESNVESIAAGVSVGWYTVSPGVVHAFAHRDADGSFDLNTRIDAPGWVLMQAFGVNASGVIAGNGQVGGADAAFRLTPSETADTTAPVISSVTASPASIFPPNGLMTSVGVTVVATDDSGDAPVCSLDTITGGPAGDAIVTSSTVPMSGSVRAVGGRTYTFHVSCHDAAGNTAFGEVDVTVTPDTTAPAIGSVSAHPDNLWPPDNRLVPVTVTVTVTDDVDPSPVCALTSITGGAPGDATITSALGATLRAVGGTTYTLNVRCTDAAGNSSNGATFVVVPADTTAPVIASVTPSVSMIWPPNGKPVTVTVDVSATDDVDVSPTCSVTKVSGGAAGDAMVTGPFSVSLKANKGALYCITVTCADHAGNTSKKDAKVSVSK